jgi:hypothetical protein
MLTVKRGNPGSVIRATAARIDSAICSAVSRGTQQDDELFSTPTKDQILFRLQASSVRERAMHLIALQMTEQIVDVLEMIGIHQQQAKRCCAGR